MVYSCFVYQYDSETNCLSESRANISGCFERNFFCESDLKNFGNESLIQLGLKIIAYDSVLTYRLWLISRWSSILNPFKARGPDVLWKAIHDCQMSNSRLITTLEYEFKTYFKGLRFHHALWGWSLFNFSNQVFHES